MDRSAEALHLDYGPPGAPVKYPRLWRLALGLLLVSAAAWPWTDGLNAWWTSTVAIDPRLFLWAMAFCGAGLILHAMFSDLLHLRQIGIHAGGLSIHWSHVPSLLGARIEKLREVAWHDVAQLEWMEGTLEHDLKQRLVICLKTPLNRQQIRLNLLVCDHQNAALCEALLAHLPDGVAAPNWLASARLRRPVNTV
ncbi:hypothetical protein [Hydrogenophaga sp.]|uniref:hypothetical protein n=1 Tax=Hydrogenophaga sp. TaxID=1904254 RepID=UPI003562FEB9